MPHKIFIVIVILVRDTMVFFIPTIPEVNLELVTQKLALAFGTRYKKPAELFSSRSENASSDMAMVFFPCN